MMTDPIADMLTRIRNAQLSRHATVTIPFSKLKKGIADILLKEEYIGSIAVGEEFPKTLIVTLKYREGRGAIQELRRVSKPGHRVYRKADELPKILNGFGVAIVSTPKGLMTNKEAKKSGIGGEVICSVY